MVFDVRSDMGGSMWFGGIEGSYRPRLEHKGISTTSLSTTSQAPLSLTTLVQSICKEPASFRPSESNSDRVRWCALAALR